MTRTRTMGNINKLLRIMTTRERRDAYVIPPNVNVLGLNALNTCKGHSDLTVTSSANPGSAIKPAERMTTRAVKQSRAKLYENKRHCFYVRIRGDWGLEETKTGSTVWGNYLSYED